MTNYTITVNGKAYEVTVEKKADIAVTGAVKLTEAVPAVAPVPASPAAPVTTAACTGGRVTAPMPGKIVAVKVNVGSKVNKGQEVVIVEAMKMHNPVLASSDGVITEIYVKAGDPVQTGAVLVLIS
ncbi:biotin/lipoyl attachment [Lucifera butyrica]|uniref:Biotin/lipoyl attachment n=1 Tax=Lucifera butyrica TaxID=1351585 RepID=A0A498R906_9FIRM|nr:biotin/lipoyl-containing protein [Lucifera butyrica]VBB09196.1 biotin/lipoyl attachment [Lucifera butyrica]